MAIIFSLSVFKYRFTICIGAKVTRETYELSYKEQN